MENHENIFAPDDIQICKPFSMVNNRIEYFLKSKRKECDDRNTRMYCNSASKDNFGSSRTYTTIENKRLKTSECFVKNTKVYNDPESCNIGKDSTGENNCTLSNNTNSVKPDVRERISNLEKCLNIETDKTDNMNIYEKLKSIENHVLNLQMKFINNEGSHSPNICTNDQHVEIINQDLKRNDNSIQETMETTNITENNLKNEHNKLTSSVDMPKKSKYTVEEIKQLINDIKNNDVREKNIP